jgi:hypothetical protein
VTPDRHLATLRQIEQEEDQRQRLELLKSRFQVALRRQGLGHLANAQSGDRPLSGVAIMESGWWLLESE